MKAIAAFFLIVSAPAALAFSAPGPPPWHCSPHAACNGDDVCVPISPHWFGFGLSHVGEDKKRYRIDKIPGPERFALELPSLEEADRFVSEAKAFSDLPYILVRNDRVGDAHGFWLLTPAYRFNGVGTISNNRTLIGCDSVLTP